MKHTPGPWLFSPELSEIRTEAPDETSEFGNGTPIVKVPYTNEGYRNARLIAAAPELFAALDGVMQILRNYQGDMPMCIEADLFGPLKDAYAAIQKATGGAR